MGDEPENLILKQLAALRGDVQSLRDEMRDGLGKVENKIGAMAGAVVGVQRDVKELRRDVARLDETVTTLGIAVAAHNDRLEHIEDRLGIDRPNLFPPA
jgi:septal ring factor EnvC (AmiA/AmiB activator)